MVQYYTTYCDYSTPRLSVLPVLAFAFSCRVKFKFKSDTDLYALAELKTTAPSLEVQWLGLRLPEPSQPWSLKLYTAVVSVSFGQ